MDKGKLLASAIEVAKATLPMVPLGAAGLAIGKAVLDMIEEAKAVQAAGPAQVAEYEAARAELESAVNDHAARTAASLGGEGE